MRKNLWKVAVVAVVLALGAMVMSASAADTQQKPAPCAMSGAKAAPAEMKGCSMHGAQTAETKGCAMKGGAAGDMQCCGKCCCMQGGAKPGQGCGMQGGAMQARGHECRGAMAGQGCGMHAGAMPGCGMGPGAGMGMACDPVKMQELGLTPEQQRKMADIHEHMQRQVIQIEADLRIAQLDMQKLMQAESPDRAQIEAQIDRIAGLEAAMKKARIATQLEARSLLTPEQVRKMHEGPATCGAKEVKPATVTKPTRPGFGK
jgi:Spy/CpxP family protein refolding chaperone